MKQLFKKRDVKEQMTPFKDLSFSQKLSYIWEYYKYYMLAAVIIVVVIISFINAYRRNNYTSECSIIIIDGKMSGYDDGTDAITTGFTEYLGIDGDKHRVECDYNYSLIPKMFDQDVSISQDKIYTLASTGSIDGYISRREYIDYFSTDIEVFFVDLREILTAAELDKIADKIVYYTKADGASIPIAVDLSETKIKTNTNLTIEDPCYGIIVSTQKLDNAAAFIRYAFDL